MTRPSRPPRTVVVVGGGISGLAAAWFLRQAEQRPDVTVLEATGRVGGAIATQDVGGHPVDCGAESMLARRPEAVDLVRAVGLGDRLEPPVTTAARVMVDGVLRDFPARTILGVPSDPAAVAASGVLTRRGLARLYAERVLPASPQPGDVSVGRYVTSRMGREVTERLVEPLLGGVYAGRADRLSLEATMPSVAAARRVGDRLTATAARLHHAAAGSADGSAPFAGIAGGLGQLTERLAATPGVCVRTRTVARQLRRRPDGRWDVIAGPVPAPEVLTADGVVLATPAGPAARLLRTVSPTAASLLEVVDYASVAIISLAYRRCDLALPALDGSGHLVPPREGRSVKAVTYSSAKWGWLASAAPDVTLVRMSVGRFDDTGDLRRDDPDLVRLATEDAADVLAVAARPVAGSVARWGGSLPQYTVGHASRTARVHGALATHPGLAMCGAALDGVGIPACIGSARAAAAAVMRPVVGGDTMRP